MKTRSLNELVDYLGNNTKTRKRELIAVNSELAAASPADHILRTAIVFAYAHWEGFVRDASRAYVNYATSKTRPVKSYSLCFQALASRIELSVAQGSTKKIAPHLSVVSLLVDNLEKSCRIDAGIAIDTESKLTSEVFENICLSIGFVYHGYWSAHGPQMDDLYTARCGIAHGELAVPDIKHAKECVAFTISSVSTFSTDILNAAGQRAFLRQ